MVLDRACICGTHAKDKRGPLPRREPTLFEAVLAAMLPLNSEVEEAMEQLAMAMEATDI